MKKARPLLNRAGWTLVAAFALVVGYLIVDQPVADPQVLTGIVTQVYVATPQYSANTVHCRVQVQNDFYIDGHCSHAQVGAHVSVCKTSRRLTGMPSYAIC